MERYKFKFKYGFFNLIAKMTSNKVDKYRKIKQKINRITKILGRKIL